MVRWCCCCCWHWRYYWLSRQLFSFRLFWGIGGIGHDFEPALAGLLSEVSFNFIAFVLVNGRLNRPCNQSNIGIVQRTLWPCLGDLKCRINATVKREINGFILGILRLLTPVHLPPIVTLTPSPSCHVQYLQVLFLEEIILKQLLNGYPIVRFRSTNF